MRRTAATPRAYQHMRGCSRCLRRPFEALAARFGCCDKAVVHREPIALPLGRPLTDVAALLEFVEFPASLDAPILRGSTEREEETSLDAVADEPSVNPMNATLELEIESLQSEGIGALKVSGREVRIGRYGRGVRDPETIEGLALRLA